MAPRAISIRAAPACSGLDHPSIPFSQIGAKATAEYQGGALAVTAVAAVAGIAFREGSGDFLIAAGSVSGKSFRLVKPLTYMNRSGAVLAPLAASAAFDPGTELLVLVDGRRFVPTTISGVVDSNVVPTALIERIDLDRHGERRRSSRLPNPP